MKKTLLFLLFFLQTLLISAQNPTDIDTPFGVFPGFNNPVLTTAVQSDGKILLGGYFITFQGLPANYLIRLNTDGSRDESFNLGKGLNGSVFSILVQEDGKILIGGNFTKFQDINQNYLIRLNPDGSKDNSFNIGTGFIKSKDYDRGGTVHTLLVEPDGKILVGGGFKSYQGISQNYLIRLNSDGTKDTTFDIAAGFDSIVYCLTRQSDGKILVGGGFNKFQNESQNNLIRLNADGSKDSDFSIINGFNSGVRKLLVLPNGKILAGGWFFQFQGEIKTGLICLNSDGSKDIPFNLNFGLNNNVESLALQPDGKIVVGGNFVNYTKSNQNHVLRLNSDGTIDTSFITGTGFGEANGYKISSISLQNDGKLVMGGDFYNFQEIRNDYLIRLNPDGSKDISFNKGNGLNDLVNTVTLQSDDKILAGGKFTIHNEISQKYLIRFNSDGSKDSSFNIESGFNDVVNTTSQQKDGKIIVGGAFKTFKNENSYYLIRLNSDGSKDNSFNTGTSGFNGNVNCTAIQNDGKILVGGLFSSYKNVSQNRLIRLNSDGSIDTSFNIGTGFNYEVLSLALQTDGKIIVGGKFKTYQGVSQNYLIRLNSDGSKDTAFNIGTGFGSTYTLGDVLTIVVQPDDKIIIGGRFEFYQGKIHNYIVRVNPDGSIDSSFKTNGGFSYYVNSIVLQKDGKILVAGGFSLYNNYSTNRIARLNSDGTIDTSFTGNNFSLGYNLISENDKVGINSIALQNDGKIVLGGAFSIYKTDIPAAFLIRLKGTYIATPLVSTITPTHITCAGSNGSASIAVSGGKSPYSYLWSNGAKTAEITGLTAGNYSCTVTDADLTTITENFTVKIIADTQNPSITAPLNISVNTNSGCEATGVALGNPITADNCSVLSVTNDAPAAFPIGNTTVTWTVKDASDNIATASQIVTVKGFDIKVTNNAGILTASETQATYKWFECNNGSFIEIPNENKISFTPIKVGSYTVEVNKNGCSVTSTCYEVKTLGTKDFDLENSLKLYPNPSKDFVTIEINAADNTKLKIFDINGNSVLSKELKDGSNTINISHLSVGVYMFEISNETGKTIKKVIKK